MTLVPNRSGGNDTHPPSGSGRDSRPPARRGAALSPLEVEQVDLLRTWTADELCHEVVNLRRAIASNRQIGAAVGVIMRERDVDYDGAFAVLRRASQDSNVPIVEVAQTVLHLRRMWA